MISDELLIELTVGVDRGQPQDVNVAVEYRAGFASFTADRGGRYGAIFDDQALIPRVQVDEARHELALRNDANAFSPEIIQHAAYQLRSHALARYRLRYLCVRQHDLIVGPPILDEGDGIAARHFKPVHGRLSLIIRLALASPKRFAAAVARLRLTQRSSYRLVDWPIQRIP